MEIMPPVTGKGPARKSTARSKNGFAIPTAQTSRRTGPNFLMLLTTEMFPARMITAGYRIIQKVPLRSQAGNNMVKAIYQTVTRSLLRG